MPPAIREFIQRHRIVSAAVCILLLLAIVGWVSRERVREYVNTRAAPPPSVYFYELSTGKVFAAPDVFPDLVKGPDGGESARAAVFSCGDCSKVSERFVAWIEREEFVAGKAPADAAARDSLWRELRDSDDRGDEAVLHPWMREPDGTEWTLRTYEALDAMQARMQARCAEKGGELAGCSAQ